MTSVRSRGYVLVGFLEQSEKEIDRLHMLRQKLRAMLMQENDDLEAKQIAAKQMHSEEDMQTMINLMNGMFVIKRLIDNTVAKIVDEIIKYDRITALLKEYIVKK
jgi:hypothetical protein